jgi:hypothetical protein
MLTNLKKDFIYYRVKMEENIHPLEDFLFRSSHVLHRYSHGCNSIRRAKRWSHQFGLMRRNKDRKALLKDKYNNPKKPDKEIWKIDIRCRNYNIYTGRSED